MDARAWDDAFNYARLLGYRSVRGLGSYFQLNIPYYLDVVVSGVWGLTYTCMIDFSADHKSLDNLLGDSSTEKALFPRYSEHSVVACSSLSKVRPLQLSPLLWFL